MKWYSHVLIGAMLMGLWVTANAALPTPLTLNQAVEHALEKNMDVLVREQYRALEKEKTRAALMKLLPDLMINARYSHQNHETPRFSRNAETRAISLDPSVSSDLDQFNFSANLGWDLLNLSINYMALNQAKWGEASEAKRLERARQDIALKVTRAYVDAVVARDIAQRARDIIQRAQNRQDILDRQITMGLVSKRSGLQNAINISEMMIRLKGYDGEFNSAKLRLAELLGIKDPRTLVLAEMDLGRLHPDWDLEELEKIALARRPELEILDMKRKISMEEARKASARFFPSITPYATWSYDDSSYLSESDWYVVGLKMSWDLFDLPSSDARRRKALSQAELDRRETLRMKLGIMTQLRLALVNYKDLKIRLGDVDRLVSLRQRLMETVEKQVKQGKLEESLLLSADQDYLLARKLQLKTMADLWVGEARIYNTAGLVWTPNNTQLTRKN